MPRSRPGRVRVARALRQQAQAAAGPLPADVAHALVRLERHELGPEAVARALATWRRLSSTPIGALISPYGRSDDLEFIGPAARDVLEDAITSLQGAPRRRLTRLVAGFDIAVQARTLPDPSRPGRRWWHRLMVD
jgi:hypothetical protein